MCCVMTGAGMPLSTDLSTGVCTSLLEFASEVRVMFYVGAALSVYFGSCSARLDRVSRLGKDCIAVGGREQCTRYYS